MCIIYYLYLIFGSHGGNRVVRVHDDVHEGVEHGEEGRVASDEPAGAGPARQGHKAVVNDVEETATLVGDPTLTV